MDYLQKASDVINGDRQADYGDMRENFERIAALWTPILGVKVTIEQFAMCMIAVKMGRLVNSPNHKDPWVDIAGYVGCVSNIHSKEESKKPMS